MNFSAGNPEDQLTELFHFTVKELGHTDMSSFRKLHRELRLDLKRLMQGYLRSPCCIPLVNLVGFTIIQKDIQSFLRIPELSTEPQ